MYDVYVKEFNVEWNIGDKVYCYYVDTGFLWRKKETVIIDISSMFIFTDEKELVYTENQKKYNTKQFEFRFFTKNIYEFYMIRAK